MATNAHRPKIGMVSLGCAKNLVDAEIMLGGAAREQFELTREPAEADVLVINTCGFIDAAKEESVDTILEMHQRRLAERPDQKIIVSGCLAQRYHDQLKLEIPEVDAFIGLDQVAEFPRIVREVLERPAAHEAPLDLVTRKSQYIPDYDTPRFLLTPSHSAYVKIAEGCNHPCSFCVIPQMRGRHRSRTIDSVVAEARQLVAQGVRELNLISQDTTYFGMDQWEQKAGPRQPVDSSRGPTLVRLLEELDQIEGDFWIRLLYTHPAHWSDELVSAIAQSRKVARYVDMPLQHIHEDMLRLMRRETSRQHIEDLIVKMRAGIPGLAIRTTFITGFPGETDEHFESLTYDSGHEMSQNTTTSEEHSPTQTSDDTDMTAPSTDDEDQPTDEQPQQPVVSTPGDHTLTWQEIQLQFGSTTHPIPDPSNSLAIGEYFVKYPGKFLEYMRFLNKPQMLYTTLPVDNRNKWEEFLLAQAIWDLLRQAPTTSQTTQLRDWVTSLNNHKSCYTKKFHACATGIRKWKQAKSNYYWNIPGLAHLEPYEQQERGRHYLLLALVYPTAIATSKMTGLTGPTSTTYTDYNNSQHTKL